MKIKVADRVSHVEEYYFSRKLKEIAGLRANGIDIINLGIGSPDLKPPQDVIDRLTEETKKEGLHGYQSYIGLPEFRQAISKWYNRKFGVQLDDRSEVLPLIGSKEGIMHISMTYLQEGDQVLIPNPGYPTYKAASCLAGAEPIFYNLNESSNWLPQLKHIQSQDLSKVKLMWINYPHMPSGATATKTDLEALVNFAHDNNILLCHDNPYSFILNDNPVSLMEISGAKEVSIELSSLSKTYNMAGWRIGFMVAQAERIKEVLRFKSNMDSGMFKPVQLAAVEALQQEDTWHLKMNNIYRKRREIAGQILSSLNCAFDPNQVGMFLWGKIPDHIEDGISYTDQVLKHAHVFITPGNIFGSNGNRYIRISLCSKDNILEKANDRISKYVKSLLNIKK